MIIEDYRKGSYIRFKAEDWENAEEVKEANEYFRRLIQHDTPRKPLKNGSLFCPVCMKPIKATNDACPHCHQMIDQAK